jgi:hypothetical protein
MQFTDNGYLEYTVQDLRVRIHERKPHECPKLDNALRHILPIEFERLGLPCPDFHDPDAFTDAAGTVPADRLYAYLDGARWAAWVIEKDSRFKEHPSLARDYRQSLIRCLRHASCGHRLSRWTLGLTPAWMAARDVLARSIPCSQREVMAMVEAGHTECFGHSLTARSPKTTAAYFVTLRDGFNKMGRYFSEHGIESPDDVRPEHLYGNPDAWYVGHRGSSPIPLVTYSRTKEAWHVYGKLNPDLKLCQWPQPMNDRNYGIRLEGGPPLIRQMLDDIFAQMPLAEKTRNSHTSMITRLVGYIQNHLGHDVLRFCHEVDDPTDLCYLLLASYPPAPDGREPAPMEEISLIINNSAYREGLLAELPRANRLHAHRGECRANPFVQAHCDWHLERANYSAADNMARTVRAINREFLRGNETQHRWLYRIYRRARDLKKKAAATPRVRRKHLMGLDPFLWDKLVDYRPTLRTKTEKVRKRMEETKGRRRESWWRMRWAVTQRDELLFGLLLAMQFRPENFIEARIDDNYFPQHYKFMLPPEDDKEAGLHYRTIPEEGPLADLRALMDEYIELARPILAEGDESPYLFLSAGKSANGRQRALKKEGVRRMWDGQLLATTRKITLRLPPGFLPTGLDSLTPYDFRHLWSNHAHEQGDAGDKSLESAGLGNKPITAHIHYVNRPGGNDRKVRKHLEQLPSKAPRDSAEVRRQARRQIEEVLGDSHDPSVVHRLMKIYDTFKTS